MKTSLVVSMLVTVGIILVILATVCPMVLMVVLQGLPIISAVALQSSYTAAAPKGSGGFGKLTRDQKKANLRSWFQQNGNTIWEFGHLITTEAAIALSMGDSVTLPNCSFDLGGKTYKVSNMPLEGWTLKNIVLWGCPTCGSANGSGHGVSDSVSVKLLEGTRWFYAPSTQRLFTISDSGPQGCWQQYFVVDHKASLFAWGVLPKPAKA